MATTIATLSLPDLGATVAIAQDGSVTLSKGWFETMTVSPMDVLELQAFLNKHIVDRKVT